MILDEARRYRATSPNQVLELAGLAREVAQRSRSKLGQGVQEAMVVEARAEAANAARILGRFVDARTSLEELGGKQADEPYLEAKVLRFRANCLVELGETEAALLCLKRARTIYLDLDDSHRVGSVSLTLGWALVKDHQARDAFPLVEEGLHLVDSSYEQHLPVVAGITLAAALEILGDPEQGLDFLSVLAEELESRPVSSLNHRVDWRKGLLLRRLGRTREAATLLSEVVMGFTKLGWQWPASMAASDLAKTVRDLPS
ncbi:MAG: hypothetical protein AAF368_20020 [Planctomycetota bacterium]